MAGLQTGALQAPALGYTHRATKPASEQARPDASMLPGEGWLHDRPCRVSFRNGSLPRRATVRCSLPAEGGFGWLAGDTRAFVVGMWARDLTERDGG